MASNMTINAVGYMADDPFYKAAEGDKGAYARFKLLHNPIGKKPGGGNLDPVAISVSAFGQQATFIGTYAKKGSQVYVQGRVTSNGLARDKDGKIVTSKVTQEPIVQLDIAATDFSLLGSKNENSEATASVGAAASKGGGGHISELNDPF